MNAQASYRPRHMMPPHDVPVAEQMRGRIHAYRTTGGDVVYGRSAVHRPDSRCPACRRWTHR